MHTHSLCGFSNFGEIPSTRNLAQRNYEFIINYGFSMMFSNKLTFWAMLYRQGRHVGKRTRLIIAALDHWAPL